MRRMIRTLLARANRRTINRSPIAQSRLSRRRLLLSALEDRTVPATFTVNALSDTGTGSLNAGDLRYCLTQAQQANSPGADTIVFDGTVFGSAQTIFVLGALPAIDNALTITGTGSSKVILDLAAAVNTPITTDPTIVIGSAISISGLTMTNADALGTMFMAFTDAKVTLTDVAMTNSKTAAGNPYGVTFDATAPGTFTPTITLNNCVVSGNEATLAVSGGGGFYSGGVRATNCDLVITGSTFANNDFDGIKTGDTTSAGGFDTGAIFVQGSNLANGGAANSFSISNSTVTGNKAWDRSGGINVVGTLKAVTVTDCTIENNSGSRGAGMFITDGTLANIQLIRSSISGNNSVVTGAGNGNLARAGGVYIADAASVTIESCSLNNNSAKNLAGAIWLGDMPDVTGFLKMWNTTIANNILPSSGGIMRVGGNPDVLAASCQLTFNNCTFANNNKGTGGNFRWFGGTLNFESCIFDGNVGGSSPNVAAFTTSTTLGTCSVKNSLVNPSSGMPAGFNVSGNILDVSAKLNALSDNGGGKLTLLPQPGSPVINTGSNPQALAFDQRGGPLHVRNYGGGVDMGAIEAITFIPYVSGTKTDGTVTASNVSKYNIQITFADNTDLIDVSSLGTGDIRITGKSFPSGVIATFDHVEPAGNGTPRTAFYYINSPGAFFVPGDNGPYSVSVVANEIKTVDNRFVPAGLATTFNVAVSQTFTVDTTTDNVDAFDGLTSLREAINAANGSIATDFIAFSSLFASPQTITLDSALATFLVNDNLVINNPGSRLTIDGNQKGVFQVTADSLSITNLRIFNANAGQGSAINSLGTQDITINNCEFDSNSSGLGGAIHLNAGSLTLTNSRFTSNKSTGNAGAIYLRIGTVVIDRCTFDSNTASTEGGAIDVNFNANFAVDLTIRNTTFSGNSAAQGGALYVDQAASFLMENSTVSGNSTSAAGKGGGGIFVNVTASQKGSTTIRNSTIVNNISQDTVGAGGLNIVQTTGDPITITSTILASNTAASGAPDYKGPTSATFSRSLLGVANVFTPLAGDLMTGVNLFGSDATPLNPQVSPLALNLAPAGSPLTHALQVSSPALDAGSNPAGLLYDQRGPGFPRQLKTSVDIGAFEGVLPIPSGALTPLGPIVAVGSTPNTVVVTYSDDVGINFSSIGIGDIEILDPANNPLTISSVKVDIMSNGTPRVATYTFGVPVNTLAGWDASDNGTYTVNLLANEVFDIDVPSNAAAAQKLGTFKVAVPNTYVVDEVSDNDDGMTGPNQLSLREAINKANTDNGPTLITFSPTVFATQKSIIMTFGEMLITEAVTITGPTAGFVINANFTGRIFNTDSAPTGAVIVMSNLTMTNGKLNTTAATDAGGAIYIGDEDVTLNNCTLTNNTTPARGGAIGMKVSSKLTLNDCIVTGNTVTGADAYGIGDGGAISINGGAASLVLNRTTMSGNTATGNGGAIYFAYDGSLNVDASTISGNSAGGAAGGGGVYFFRNVTAAGFNITNSTISGNKATAGPGGGIALNSLVGTVNIRNSTLTLNEAASGGGGVDQAGGAGVFFLSSTIVAQNKSAGSTTVARADVSSNAATNVAGNNNLVGVMDATNLVTLTGTGNQVGTTATPLNAKLGALTNNGGPTLTHALLAMSPALNMGNNILGLANDQRGVGFSRSKGVTDVGAYEDQTVVAPPPQVGTIVVDDGTAQRSLLRSFVVNFNEAVNYTAGAFTLTRTFGGAGTVGLTLSPATGPASSVTITFNNTGTIVLDPQSSLPDGKYQLTIVAPNVTGGGGTLDGNKNGVSQGSPTDDVVLVTHRLFGDADGSGTVTASDFNAFRLVYGSAGPSIFDFDGVAGVSASDFNAFRLRYGVTIP